MLTLTRKTSQKLQVAQWPNECLRLGITPRDVPNNIIREIIGIEDAGNELPIINGTGTGMSHRWMMEDRPSKSLNGDQFRFL